MNTSINDKNILKLIDVCKTYKSGSRDIDILKNINLEINRGDFLALMGKSGCGKTTLLNILGFMDDLSSGTYIFDGEDSRNFNSDMKAKIRNKKIGFVFQSYNLINNMTATENVEIPMGYGGVSAKARKERAHHLLETVGLADRYNHIPAKLSGGEQQRVAIARALSNEPLLILADEPTGNLDEKSRSEILDILKALNDGGTTIAMVTHDESTVKYASGVISIIDGSFNKPA